LILAILCWLDNWFFKIGLFNNKKRDKIKRPLEEEALMVFIPNDWN